MAIETKILRMRQGKEADFDVSKLLPGEFAVSLDKQKVRIGFGAGKTKELASIDDVNDKITEFKNTVDGEIAEAVAEVEEAGQRVLATIPADYTETAQKADEAIRTKASAITCEAEGESIVVSDSSGDYMRGLKIYGRTEQTTTTGAQLIPYPYVSTHNSDSAVIWSENADRSIAAKISAAPSHQNWFALAQKHALPAGTYTLSGCPAGGAIRKYWIYVQRMSDGNIWHDFGNGVTFEVNEGDTFDFVANVSMDAGAGSTITFKPMLNAGSTVLPYEDYTGGKASPSMTYPQPMQNRFEGMENLIKFSLDTEKTVSGLKFTPSDNDLIVNGTYSSGGIWLEIGTVKLTAGETYTLHCAADISIHLYDSTNDKEYVTKHAGTASIVITPNESISCAVVINNVNTQKTYKDYKISVMLNKGTTALPYRPHGHNVRAEVLTSNLFGGDALADKLVAIGGRKDENGTVTFAGSVVGDKPIHANFKPNTQYTFVFYGKNIRASEKYVNLKIIYDDKTADTIYFSNAGVDSYAVLVSKTGKSIAYLAGQYANESTTLYCDKCGIFEGVKTLDDFEPYTQQTLTHAIEGGLGGIKTKSKDMATYTDANGNMYRADYLDEAAGEWVQRCENWYFTGGERWTDYGSTDNILRVWTNALDAITPDDAPAYCNCFINFNGVKTGCFYIYSGNGKTAFCVDKAMFPSVDSWKAKLAELYAAGNPVTVTYLLATPIRHPLKQSEIAAFKQLHTNYPHTTFLNDAGAWMEMKYNADTKIYIDNKFEQLQAAIINSLT